MINDLYRITVILDRWHESHGWGAEEEYHELVVVEGHAAARAHIERLRGVETAHSVLAPEAVTDEEDDW